jgi:hypothetical protein
MLTEEDVKRIMLEAVAEFGGDPSILTEDSGRHIASKLRARLRQRGATDADIEAIARKLIDEFVLLPGATMEFVAGAIRAISDGLGFDARLDRLPDGNALISLTPKRMH